MTPITSEEFLERYPEFKNVSSALVTRIIDKATLICSGYIWKNSNMGGYAIQALAAHELAVGYFQQMLMADAIARLQKGEKVSDWKILDYYQASVYGQDFLRIMKLNRSMSMFVI